MERREKITVSAKYCDGEQAKSNKHGSERYKQPAHIDI